METTQYKTYIGYDAEELLPNGEEATRHVVWWNVVAELLSKTEQTAMNNTV